MVNQTQWKIKIRRFEKVNLKTCRYSWIVIFFKFQWMSFLGISADQTFHNFKADNIDGDNVGFSSTRGKVSIVVNVASEWGLAKYHYPQLQKFYEKYHQVGLEIFAFPCNQFMHQEPGTNAEIKGNIEAPALEL